MLSPLDFAGQVSSYVEPYKDAASNKFGLRGIA